MANLFVVKLIACYANEYDSGIIMTGAGRRGNLLLIVEVIGRKFKGLVEKDMDVGIKK